MLTWTLGRSALQAAALEASYFLPIPKENRPKLIIDLEADPFVANAIKLAMCELYRKYGMYLAPFTAAITTAKYCEFGQSHQQRISKPGISGGDDTSTGETNYSGEGGDSSATDKYESNETKVG